jgi:hypothetical protein
MAKKGTSSKSGGSSKSRSLVYAESYYQNRNDMLQSSLDSVYQRIDSEQLAYEARLKATKDVTRELDKEIARIKKLRDDLAIKQLDKNAASQQWTAGQRNAANRTEFLVKASNSRFLADKAADRAMYGTRDDTRAAGIPGLDETSENEANRSYTSFPDDPNAGLKDLLSKISGVGEFDKSQQQKDLTAAYGVDTYVANEIAKLDRGEGDPGVVAAYQDFAGDRAAGIKPDLKAQKAIALRIVFDKITDPAIVEAANRGYDIAETLSKKRGAGVSDEELAKMVYSGSIPVNPARPPDYSALRGELDKRLADLEMKRTEVTPEAPIPLSERDVIEEQRDEFFRTFYPGAKPAYQVNRLIDSILSGNLDPQSEAIIQEIISSEGKARRMPAEGPLGPEIEDRSGRRGFTGKEGARMPGDIIYGEGSPFVPEESPLSDKALKILSNEGLNQFFGEGLSDAKIEKRSNDLFQLGLGLTKVTKEDGKVLYTVVPYNRLGSFKPENVVMPTTGIRYKGETSVINQQISALEKEIAAATAGAAGGLSPFNIFASIAGEKAAADLGMQSLAGKQATLNRLKKQREDELARRPSFTKPEEELSFVGQTIQNKDILDLDRRIGSIEDGGLLKDLYLALGNQDSPAKTEKIESIKKELIDLAQRRNILMNKPFDINKYSKELDDAVRLRNTITDAIELTGDPGGELATSLKKADELIVSRIFRQDFMEREIKEAAREPVAEYIFTPAADRREVRRILQPPKPTPERRTELERYKSPLKLSEPTAPTLVPGSDQPPAGPAIRTPTGISYPSISPDVQQTPDGRDASFKINALESAAKLVDNDELGRMLKTPVGSAVEQLYKANKAKGNQTNKELLSYIAKEFPRVEDQQTATTALFGLSYKDELSGKLG